jgi:hypothetical protein
MLIQRSRLKAAKHKKSRRLAIRYERTADIHTAFLALASAFYLALHSTMVLLDALSLQRRKNDAMVAYATRQANQPSND